MQLISVRTPILARGDNLAEAICNGVDIRENDIVVVSSKAVATTEGAAIHLDSLKVSDEAREIAEKNDKDPHFIQAVLNETARMNGTLVHAQFGVLLTELKPDGMTEGVMFVPNAGLDQSNAPNGTAIGWPLDPVASAQKLRDELTAKTGHTVGIIISDSGLMPKRIGVTAFALAVCGFQPLNSMIGKPDLFAHKMQVTEEAVADQLATAGNMLMGNCDQSTPAAVIRDHGIAFSDFCGWVPGIERERDIYHGVI